MTFSNEVLETLFNAAKVAALKAGEIIQHHTKNGFELLSKDGGASEASQVLTEVDLLCEKSIVETLSPLIEKYDIALLTEETEDDGSRFKKEYFFSIDPIDGTLPFIEQIFGYSVSIALVKNDGTPIFGVIYDPKNSDLYTAFNGKSYINGSSITQESGDILTIYLDRSFRKHERFDAIINDLNSFAKSKGLTGAIVNIGAGSAMYGCSLATHPPACYFKFPKDAIGGGSLWDFAASSCLVKNCGFIAGDMYGDAIELNRKESTYLNHKGILYATDREIQQEVQKLFQKYGNANNA